MAVYISQKEYGSFSKKLANLEKKREKLQKTLGKIMETSGSSTSKTPGFNEAEDQIKIFNKKILDVKNLLSQSKILKDLSELKKSEVTIYSFVSVLDINTNKEIKYYIQHDFSDSKKDFVIITPSSPVGRNLIGKKIGDNVKVGLPKGNLELKIINIEKKLL
jgi:transcription elongation factor GreA